MNQARTVKEVNELIGTFVESFQSLKQENAEIEEIRAGLEQHQTRLKNCIKNAGNICDDVINNTLPSIAHNGMFGVPSLVKNKALFESDLPQEQYESAKNHFLQATVTLKAQHEAASKADKAVHNKVKEIDAMKHRLKHEAEQRVKEEERRTQEAAVLALKRKKALRNKLLFTSLFIAAVAAFISLQMR